MKKLCFVFATAFAVYAMQSCNSSNRNSAQNADSSNMSADTLSTAAKSDSTKVDTADVHFAQQLAAGGMAEIQFSKLAEQKSNNSRIKNFAGMMVTDHTMLGDTLKNIAQRKNISLPSAMDAGHQQKYDSLSKETGAAFDKDYVNAMVADHKSAIDLLHNESKNSSDSTLRNFAGTAAKVVQKHLDAINKIHASMK